MRAFVIFLVLALCGGAYLYKEKPREAQQLWDDILALFGQAKPAPVAVQPPPVAPVIVAPPATPPVALVTNATAAAEPETPMPTEWIIDGRTYHNVVVGRLYDDRVEISYDGGVGSPALASLSPDLQRRFHYSADRAAAATQASEDRRAAAVAELEEQVRAKRATASAPPIVVAPAANTTSHKPMIDVPMVQAQIRGLEDDIRAKEKEINRIDNRSKESSGDLTSQNPFRTAIEDDKRKIADLQAQLNAQ